MKMVALASLFPAAYHLYNISPAFLHRFITVYMYSLFTVYLELWEISEIFFLENLILSHE